jgi:hypothetical protein
LTVDPTEQNNIVGAKREAALKMRKRLSAWMASQKARYGAAEK